MRKALMVVVALLGTAQLAHAQDMTATLTAVDTDKHIVGLEGKAYSVAADVRLNTFKPGDKVTVSFDPPDEGFAARGFAGVISKMTVTK